MAPGSPVSANMKGLVKRCVIVTVVSSIPAFAMQEHYQNFKHNHYHTGPTGRSLGLYAESEFSERQLVASPVFVLGLVGTLISTLFAMVVSNIINGNNGSLFPTATATPPQTNPPSPPAPPSISTRPASSSSSSSSSIIESGIITQTNNVPNPEISVVPVSDNMDMYNPENQNGPNNMDNVGDPGNMDNMGDPNDMNGDPNDMDNMGDPNDMNGDPNDMDNMGDPNDMNVNPDNMDDMGNPDDMDNTGDSDKMDTNNPDGSNNMGMDDTGGPDDTNKPDDQVVPVVESCITAESYIKWMSCGEFCLTVPGSTKFKTLLPGNTATNTPECTCVKDCYESNLLDFEVKTVPGSVTKTLDASKLDESCIIRAENMICEEVEDMMGALFVTADELECANFCEALPDFSGYGMFHNDGNACRCKKKCTIMTDPEESSTVLKIKDECRT